jgi:hypothetical protein
LGTQSGVEGFEQLAWRVNHRASVPGGRVRVPAAAPRRGRVNGRCRSHARLGREAAQSGSLAGRTSTDARHRRSGNHLSARE